MKNNNGLQLGWLALSVALATLAVGSAAEDQPNPPQWPATVRVFSPSDTDIEDVVNAAYAINGGHTPADHGQFSSARYAFLFKPGNYSATVPVGYYTTIAGLGASPLDVVFNGKMGVFCPEGDYDMTGGALDTFWRSAENFRMSTSFEWMGNAGMLWAVSQAAPLRRVVVDGDLSLYEYEPPFGGAGYSSGGFLANSNVTGSIYAGSQQQWFSRNSHLGWWKGGVWNMVFVGCDGDVYQSGCEAVWTPGPAPGAVTNVALTPVVAEKPFIIVDNANPTKFSLAIPKPRFNSTGSDWDVGDTVPFEQVYVASNATDTSATINAKLSAGLHVVLAPGIYTLDTALVIAQPGQVLLGLGMATLVSGKGDAVVAVTSKAAGARVAGLLLQAGHFQTATLLRWGDRAGDAGDAANPGVLSDVFGRVGGPDAPAPAPEVQADVLLTINSDNVVIDNTWWERNTIWQEDNGQSFMLSWITETDETNFTVRDSTVIHVEHLKDYGDRARPSVIGAVHGGVGRIGGYHFSNITVEGDVFRPVGITVEANPWGHKSDGTISGIDLKGVTFMGSFQVPSLIHGRAAANTHGTSDDAEEVRLAILQTAFQGKMRVHAPGGAGVAATVPLPPSSQLAGGVNRGGGMVKDVGFYGFEEAGAKVIGHPTAKEFLIDQSTTSNISFAP